ncbi:hypothetical protein CRM22_010728 [Opisthorchis felineus]|uniref:Uncharacterized protein n=1 Tax=Opisthorchis felineus TaxID=147828 RepID=A0A4S2KPX6_OPIFE|nr:hypothetical protein CRM22_010728 [Opisthorchis felineus]
MNCVTFVTFEEAVLKARLEKLCIFHATYVQLLQTSIKIHLCLLPPTERRAETNRLKVHGLPSKLKEQANAKNAAPVHHNPYISNEIPETIEENRPAEYESLLSSSAHNDITSNPRHPLMMII